MTARFKSQIQYRSKQNTVDIVTFVDHNSRDFTETTMAVNMSQNKGFIELYNGSARVINLCTFPSQPTQNKQAHHGSAIFIKPFLHEFSCS